MRAQLLSLALLLLAFNLPVRAADPDPAEVSTESIRPITDADSIFAIYTQDFGLRTDGRKSSLIFAAWPDGRLIWSENPTQGGKPYRTATIHPAMLEKVLTAIKGDGLFNDPSLAQPRFGPDSNTTVIYVRTKRDQLKMQSWHELYEAGSKVVATEAGLVPLAGRSRPEVLRGASAEYLYYRLTWSDLRLAAAQLIPTESQPAKGTFEFRKGKALWIDQN